MWRQRSVSSKIATRLRLVATDRGYDFADLLRHYELNNFAAMESYGRITELEHSKILQLYELPAISQSIHSVAAHEGLAFIFNDFTDYISICSTSPTLASAIENYVRYRVLVGTCDDVDFTREGDTIKVEYRCTTAQSDLARHAYIYLSTLTDLIKNYAMGNSLKVSLSLTNERVDVMDGVMTDILNALEFCQPNNTLTVTASWLDEQRVSGISTLHKMYEQKILTEIQALDVQPGFSKRVANLILNSLYQGERSDGLLKLLCSKLYVSRATLHRKLAAENTSFSEVLNDIRKKEVVRLMGSQPKTITEISQLLGFSNVSSFNRFMKNNFSSTPSEFKTHLRNN